MENKEETVNKYEFIDLCGKFMETIGNLKIMSGWSPYYAVKEVRKSGIFEILPERFTWNLCASHDGRVVIESTYSRWHNADDCKKNKLEEDLGIGKVEYWADEAPHYREFRMWLNSTPATEETARIIQSLNEGVAQKSKQYLSEYLKDPSAYADRVDVYAVNGGSERLYAVRSKAWMKNYPAVIGIDMTEDNPSDQRAYVSVLRPYVSDRLEADIGFSVQELPVECGISLVRILAAGSGSDFNAHRVRVYSDGDGMEIRHFVLDGVEEWTEEVDYFSDPICQSEMTEGDLAVYPAIMLSTLHSEDEVEKAIKERSDDGIGIVDRIVEKNVDASEK